MPRAPAFIARRGEDVTLQTLALDTAARDATTKWAAASYTETTIKVIVSLLPGRRIDVGGVPESDVRAELYTASAIHRGDRIVYNGVTYTIVSEPNAHRKGGKTSFYTADMERIT